MKVTAEDSGYARVAVAVDAEQDWSCIRITVGGWVKSLVVVMVVAVG